MQAYIFFLAALALLVQATSTNETHPADNQWLGVDHLDVPKYTGGWYEVMSSRAVREEMERGCSCSQVYYKLNETNPDSLDVTNACTRFGRYTEIKGSAKRDNPEQFPGRFKVKLDLPWWARYRMSPTQMREAQNYPEKDNYLVLKMYRGEDGNYQQALIGGGESKYFWLISRTPRVEDDSVMEDALKVAECYGYNTESPYYQDQNECPWTIPQPGSA